MFRVVSLIGVLSLTTITVASAQPTGSATQTSFPRVIRIAGTLPQPAGAPSPTDTITFAIYADETGETPLWQETQTVMVDSTGAYSALLGATTPDGLPLEIFTTNGALWLNVHLEGATGPDAARVLIASVAYALRAADADTLGGRPASAYVLADPTSALPSWTSTASTATAGTRSPSSTSTSSKTGTNSVFSTSTMGTPGQLAMFTDPVDLGDSVVAQTGPRIGIGTTSPVDYLHVAFNDPFGAFAGLAVQNLSGGATAASGMLFYDQNGALTQFQGFNNSTHAYVINNIAKNTSNQFDGSIRFAIGSSTPSLTVASNGLVGIGTTTPTFAALSVISPSYKVGIYATGGAATDAGGAPGIIASGGDSGSIGGEAGAGLIATGGSDLEGVGGIGAVISAGSGRPDLGSGTAAIFHGDVTVVGNMLVAGTLVKNAGSFRIDHPLDPAHKYLSHSFVESPDMKNVYDGIAVLDANGVAWVELPEWFEALNRDFRYQLTALGVPAPGLFIASEVQRNHFEIAGGQPGARVSWMITGIRQDPYANAHRIPVEEAKPENEQGSYLNPDLYGQPRGALEQSRRK